MSFAQCAIVAVTLLLGLYFAINGAIVFLEMRSIGVGLPGRVRGERVSLSLFSLGGVLIYASLRLIAWWRRR